MKTTILLVDDRMENLFTLESILEKESRTIVLAESGAEALLKVKECNPSVILLDYQMPGMSGLEVAEYLRADEATKNIPIIFITAISKNEFKKLQIFEEGTVEIIGKPIDIYEARNRVVIFERLYHFQQLALLNGLVNHE